jgi:aldose 1-epimerase
MLDLSSDCQYWVVYTEPTHALCVEPQTDAPDAFNRFPTMIAPGNSLEAWFDLSWRLEP